MNPYRLVGTPILFATSEPISRIELDRPPYEGRAAGHAHRQSWPPWIRTRNLAASEAGVLPVELEAIEYAERDSDPQTTAFEAVSVTS